MNKKVLLLGMTSILAVGTVAAVAFTYGRDGYPLIGAKAALKTFTFNDTVGANQFDGTDNDKVVERSVVTGVGSNMETSVSLTESTTQRDKAFGYNNWFVKMIGGLTNPTFHLEFGVNNVTNVSVTFGLIKNGEYTVATQVGCSINIYGESGYIDGNASCGTSLMNTESTLTWTKDGEETKIGNSVIVEVYVPDGFVHFQDPLYIKSITIDWEC